MATATFDTLKFANTLKAAGVPDNEAQASVLGEALAVNFRELVTKDDLATTKDDLTRETSALRAELQNDIRQTEQRVNAKIDSVEQRLSAKIDGVEQGINAKIDGVEQGLNAKIDGVEQGLNARIDGVEQRLNARLDGVEQRLNAKTDNIEQRLNAKIDTVAAKFDGQFTLLKWMIGLPISLNVAVLIRLFMARIP